MQPSVQTFSLFSSLFSGTPNAMTACSRVYLLLDGSTWTTMYRPTHFSHEPTHLAPVARRGGEHLGARVQLQTVTRPFRIIPKQTPEDYNCICQLPLRTHSKKKDPYPWQSIDAFWETSGKQSSAIMMSRALHSTQNHAATSSAPFPTPVPHQKTTVASIHPNDCLNAMRTAKWP